MATLKQIADDLEVSVAAVSYVYNNKWREKRIKENLARKIQKKLKEENYQPNILGRQLKTRKTQTIGVVLGDLTRNFNLNILAGVEKVLAPADYLALVCNSRLGVSEKRHLETLLARNVEGIILSPNTTSGRHVLTEKLKVENTPVVLVDNYLPQLKTDFVVSDNFWGSYKATELFIREGYKKILYLGSKKNLTALKERFQGYVSALKNNGVPLAKNLIYRKLEAPEEVYSALQDIFSRETPEAIFSESLLYFKEGFRFLAKQGLRIPKDIALTGFDPVELPLNEFSALHFNSLIQGHIPFVEQRGIMMGELAAQILISRIKEEKGKTSQIFVKPNLQFYKGEEILEK